MHDYSKYHPLQLKTKAMCLFLQCQSAFRHLSIHQNVTKMLFLCLIYCNSFLTVLHLHGPLLKNIGCMMIAWPGSANTHTEM